MAAPKFRVKEIDSSFERNLVIGMVVSTRVCQEIYPHIKYEYFLTTYTRTIARWCMEYYDTYAECPARNISQVFERERVTLADQDVGIIEHILTEMSDRYEQDGSFNEDYLLNKTMEYFRKRSLTIRSNNTIALLQDNKVAEAELEFSDYKPIERTTSDWVNPFTMGNVIDVVHKNESPFFLFPGALGKMLGPISRGWMLSFMGPRKRGKSFNMIDWAVDFNMSGLNVALFSLEMGVADTNERLFRRLTAFGREDKEYQYPCFDCVLNQTGECNKAQRTNRITLLDDPDEEVEFSPDSKYKPCQYCRHNFPKDYQPTVWWELITREKMEVENTWNRINMFRRTFGDRIRLKCYPKFSANLRKVEADLDMLEQREGFIPDAIIIDYADILAPEDTREQGRDRIDTTWKTFSRMVSVRNCLGVTATQSNRGSDKKTFVEQEDAAEDIRKLAHVDVMLGINQTKKEKRKGVMRLGVVAHRHHDFDEETNVLMLQQLGLGQVHLDSLFVRLHEGTYQYIGG